MAFDAVAYALAKKLIEQAGESGALHGKSAYEIAVDYGYEGTEADFVKDQHGYPPFIITEGTIVGGKVGNWAVYDSSVHNYVDSGVPAQGEAPEFKIEDGHLIAIYSV